MTDRQMLETEFAGFQSRLTWQTFRELLDDTLASRFETVVKLLGASAGAFWIPEHRDGCDGLVIAANVGDRGDSIAGSVFQPLDKGLVSMAFVESRLICHQGMFSHRNQSDVVDRNLQQVTAHQIAGPLKMFDQKIGALTVIQSIDGNFAPRSKWGFEQREIDLFEFWCEVLAELLENRFCQKIQKG